MKTNILRWGLPLLALALPTTARATTTVAAEYCTQDAVGNATLGNAQGNASGWLSTMQSFGYSRRYLYGNGAFWPDDLVSYTVPGGKDNLYGDTPNLLFLESHGGSDADKFRITTGAIHTIDGQSTGRSWTRNPSNLNQWWSIGDQNLRILSMLSCDSLQLTDLAHWDAVTPGLHMLTGGNDSLYDNAGRGGNYAYWGNVGCSVKQAWFQAHWWGNETAVVMAYGVNSADAYNRRDNEHFNWSMAPLGPHTYRAWSWIH